MFLFKKEENLFLEMSEQERKLLSDALEFFILSIQNETNQEKLELMLGELNSI